MLLQGLQGFHDSLTLISSVVILTLGFILSGIALPKEDIWNKLRLVRRYMATSYITLGVACLLIVVLGRPVGVQPLLIVSSLFVAATQILFFTCILLTIIESPTLKKSWVFNQISLTMVMGTILTACCVQTRFNVDYWLFGIVLVTYIFQNIYYIYVYRRDLALYVAKHEGDLNRRQKIHLRWGRTSFNVLLVAASLGIVASIFGGIFYLVCMGLCLLLYIYMVVRFYNDLFWGSLNYNVNNFSVAEVDPVAVEESREEASAWETEETAENDEASLEKDEVFHERLRQWIAVKGYLDKNLSVDDMAEALSVSRNYLRYYFRTYVKMEFRTWRSELRIHEALKIMEMHPEYALSKVAELVGYNHRSNFFKQFENITGISPSVYKESCERKKMGLSND